jgi:hypothetical protein
MACNGNGGVSNTTGLDKEKFSFEDNDVESTNSDEDLDIDENSDSDEDLDIDENSDSDEDLDSDEDSDADEDFDTEESSDSVESSDSNESSSSEDDSSSSLDDNSSSSMAVTCQALTLECYSATQLCNKGLTEYCVNSSASNNSSSSAEETCKHVSDVDGGTCQDNDVVLDCATGVNAVCNNNKWIPAIIGDPCQTSGKEMTVNDINLICNEGYWKYKSTIDNCPPGNYSCQPPNYDCGTHPINGFSCDEHNEKVYELIVYTRGAGDCLYQCSGGKYSVVMPPAPVGN